MVTFVKHECQTWMHDHTVLEVPHKTTAGDHQLEGVGTGTIYGTVIEVPGRK